MAPTPLSPMLLMVFLLWIQGTAAWTCQNHGQIECKSGGQCIDMNHVCRSGTQCADGSDEDPYICQFWKDTSSQCSGAAFRCAGNCFYIYDFCDRAQCSNTIDSRVCKMVKERKLHIAPESMDLTPDMMTLLRDAVNSTSESKFQDCPFLYTKVNDLCVAFFSPAKIPWAEARQFCRSIYGDLISFHTLTKYKELLDYMRESLLTSDYWIGGRYDIDNNSWSWVNDGSPMPLGTPYWAQRHNSSCVLRSPPHTNPFSDPPAALPGAKCHHYIQAPSNRQPGWCSALTYEHFYYMSDEVCEDAHSPICLLNVQPKDIE